MRIRTRWSRWWFVHCIYRNHFPDKDVLVILYKDLNKFLHKFIVKKKRLRLFCDYQEGGKERYTDIQMDRQTDIQIDGRTDRHTDRQTDRQTYR